MNTIQHKFKTLLTFSVCCLVFLLGNSILAQTITSFNPVNGKTGTSVIISGSGFLGTTGVASVKFGGTNAQSYTVNSNNQITALVGTGSSGSVSVTNGGTANSSGFTYVTTPSITNLAYTGINTSFSSATTLTAPVGGTVTFTATQFGTIGNPLLTSVIIGGVAADLSTIVYSASTFTITVPAGATTGTGNVSITNIAGTSTTKNFTLIPTPIITSYSTNGTTTPLSTITAASGTTIIINGTDLANGNARVPVVTIGGVTVTSQVVSGTTKIYAVVPANAASGNVVVTTNGGASTFGGFTYIPTPTITSYSDFGTSTPLSTITAAGGTKIIINGTDFSGTNLGTASVTIGGAGATISAITSTSITATVPTGAATGNVVVTNSGGTATFGGFTFIPLPVITSYSTFGSATPISTIIAASGTQIILNGTNFSGTNLGTATVTIGGVAVTTLTVNSSTMITATVPANSASGNVVVTNNGGSAIKTGFTYIPTPTVTSYSTFGTVTPISTITAASGTQIIINGTNFSGTNEGVASVTIGGVAVTTLTVNSATKITATVPANAASGNVVVTNNGGTATFAGFTYIPTPTITSYSIFGTSTPISTINGAIGTQIIINGTNFSGANLGTASVTIGGASVSTLTVNSATKITATVPSGASSGNVVVSNSGGSATITGFTLVSSPTITSFNYNGSGNISTITATVGSTVTFNGTQFGTSGDPLITSITFGGASADLGTLTTNSTSLTIVVPVGAVSGDITATNIAGTVTKTAAFILIPTPTITSYSTFGTITPISTITAASGTQIIINGTNFSGANLGSASVTIGGVAVTTLTVNSATKITATVPSGAASGNVVVTNIGGTAAFGGFTYIPTPTITSYSTLGTVTPISTITAASGTQIIINGTNFSGANLGSASVTIGGVAVTTLTVNSSTTITSTVPAGAASGNVVVTNNGGSATFGGFTYIPTPTITSFTPTAIGNGSTVTITGTGYLGANITVSAVKFGGTDATSFSIIDAFTIQAVVATGTSGLITVVTTGGTATSASSFTFVAAPIVTSVSSSSALTGDLITLTGTNLSNASAVKFGGVASSFTNVSSTTITATVPTGVRGLVSVGVTTLGGVSSGNTITINNSWSGTSSSDWSTSTNWNTGFVPTTEDVVISTGLATYPVLSTNVSVGNLTLNGTFSLNGHTLTVLSSLSGSGSFISTSTSSLDMEGSGTISFDAGNNNIKNLTINNTVTLGNALNLYGVLYPSSGTFTTGGHLTLKSVSGSQGVVATVGGTISGTVTTERYIPQNTSFRTFRDLCPIVANAGSIFNNWQEGGSYTNGYGVQITGIAGVTTWIDPVKGFDASQTGSGSLETYSGSWAYATNTKTMNLNPAQGYRLLIRGNRSYSLYTTPQPKGMNSSATLRTTGNLLTGTVSYLTGGTSSTSGFSSSYGLLSGTGAFSFIGNPYASTVSWSSVLSHSAGITTEYYYLDPTFVDGSGNQSYVTYNATSGTNSNPSSNIGNDIQPGQAIFVKNDGSTTPQVIFQEADKTAGNAPLSIFGTTPNVNKLSLQLFKNSVAIDGAVAVFKSSFTRSVGTEDSKKLMNTGESITFSESGSQLCIDGVSLPTTKDTITLQLSKIIANTNYQIKLNANLFNGNGVNALIYDKYSKAQTSINADTTTISFTTTSDSATYFNRFSIIFHSVVSSGSVLGTSTLPSESINLTTTLKSSNLVVINWSAINSANIASYSLQRSTNGTEFSNIKSVSVSNSTNFSYIDANASDGMNYYRVKAIDKVGGINYSSVSKLLVGKVDNIFIVYPNPVINKKNFSVQLNDFAIGTYTIKLFNNLGQVVLSKKGYHGYGSLLESINLENSNLASGVYIVKISAVNGQSYQKEINVN